AALSESPRYGKPQELSRKRDGRRLRKMCGKHCARPSPGGRRKGRTEVGSARLLCPRYAASTAHSGNGRSYLGGHPGGGHYGEFRTRASVVAEAFRGRRRLHMASGVASRQPT